MPEKKETLFSEPRPTEGLTAAIGGVFTTLGILLALLFQWPQEFQVAIQGLLNALTGLLPFLITWRVVKGF